MLIGDVRLDTLSGFFLYSIFQSNSCSSQSHRKFLREDCMKNKFLKAVVRALKAVVRVLKAWFVS